MRNRILNLYYSPLDIISLARDTQLHVKNALKSTNFHSMQEMVSVLDEVSDKMCVVTDSSECIRRLHPDIKWRRSADRAFNEICNLMNELNSDKKLIEQFIANEKGYKKGHDHELDAVVNQFKRDFDIFYNLNHQQRAEISKLQSTVEQSVSEFEKRQTIDSLEQMIKLRFELARALGFKSPSEMSLRDKQIKSSENVMSFLNGRWKELQRNTPDVRHQLSFTNLKKIINVLVGLSRDLFGVHVEVKPSHDLAGNVSFSMYANENSKVVGEIIFDLAARKLKDSHPTHYTIQCRKSNTPALILISMSIADLERISWNQSQSIFHEYGHAMHSVLSETKYQMLSGTRGAVDIAEIPSTLFELIHDDRKMQRTLTDSDELLSVKGERILKEETFQLQISAMDQLLHSIEPGDSKWTCDLAHQIEKDFGNKLETNWHCKVKHFASYGGGYFAYSFSKSVAERIWKTFPQGSHLFKSEFLVKGGTAKIDFIK